MKNYNPQRMILSINPDLKNGIGHLFQIDRLIEHKAKQLNYTFLSACNQKCDKKLVQKFDFLKPTFSHYTWDFGKNGVNQIAVKLFETEFERLITRIIEENQVKQLYIFMYNGNLEFGLIISSVLRKKQINAKINIQLYWELFSDYTTAVNKDYVYNSLSKIKDFQNLVFLSCSAEQSKQWKNEFNLTPKIFPQASTTFSDELIQKRLDNTNLSSGKPSNVLFPANSKLERGYKIAVEFSNYVCNQKKYQYIEPTLRRIRLKKNKEFLNQLMDSIHPEVNIIEGALNIKQYRKMLIEADISILPYNEQVFKIRPSGALVDSLLLGIPTIAPKNTYLGNKVEFYGNGLIYEYDNFEMLIEAFDILLDDFDKYYKSAQIAAKKWFRKNNWEETLKVIVDEQ